MALKGLQAIVSKTGALAPVLRRACRQAGARWRTVLGIVFLGIGAAGLMANLLSYSLAKPADVLLTGQQATATGPDAFGSDRFLVPEADISMPLITGGQSALEQGAWLAGKTRPGQPGNTVIFGHRFKYLPPLRNTMFRLDELEVGETFTVRWHDVEYVYRVSEVKIVEPTEISVIRDFGDERVTLITCTPIWSTSHRLVVVGIPVAL